MIRQNIFSSFRNAFNGILHFSKKERNGKIQLTVGIIAICFALYYHISSIEWMAVLLCIGAVISLEMLNSAIEKLCDLVQPCFHPVIKIVKDVAAGGVLFASIISVSIAAIIFIPKIFHL